MCATILQVQIWYPLGSLNADFGLSRDLTGSNLEISNLEIGIRPYSDPKFKNPSIGVLSSHSEHLIQNLLFTCFNVSGAFLNIFG